MGHAQGLSRVGPWPEGALGGKAMPRKQGGSSRHCGACGWQKYVPKGVHVLTPGTCECYVTWQGPFKVAGGHQVVNRLTLEINRDYLAGPKVFTRVLKRWKKAEELVSG